MTGRRFIYSGILASAVGIALRTVTLVFAAYISRTVGAEGVGLNTLIVSAYGFALTFATSGINLTTTRLVASHMGERDEGKIAPTLRGATVYALLFSSLATFVLAGFSGFFATVCLGDRRAIIPLQVLSVSLIPSAMLGVISGYFVARRAVVRNSAIQLFSQAMRITVTVVMLVTVGQRGVETAVLALCVGSAVGELLSCVFGAVLFAFDRARCVGRGARGVSIAPVAEMAMPLAMSSYVRSGLLSVEHSVIPHRLKDRGDSSADALSSFGGLHGMALPMVIYPMTPLSSFATLLMPEFAQSESAGDRARMSRMARSAISLTLAYAILMAVMLFVFSEDIGYSVYNSYSAGHFISVLAPVVPIMYVDHVVDSMLKGIGEQVYSMWINIIDSALSVILVWLLIPPFGIEGYAIVIILMEAFNFSLSYARLSRRIRIKIDPVSALLIPMLSAFASAFAVKGLFARGSALPAWTVASKLVFSLCFFGAVLIPLSFVYKKLSARKKQPQNSHKCITEDK